MPFINEAIEKIEDANLKEVLYSTQELGLDFYLGILILFSFVIIYVFRGFFGIIFSLLLKSSLLIVFSYYVYRMFFI